MKKIFILTIIISFSFINLSLANPTLVCLSEHSNYKIEFFLSNTENPVEGTIEAKEYNFGYNPYGSWETGQPITCQPPLKDNKKFLAFCGIRHGPDAATKIYLYQKNSSGKYQAGAEAFGPDGKSGGERKLTCEAPLSEKEVLDLIQSKIQKDKIYNKWTTQNALLFS